MTLRVEKIGDRLGILLTAADIEALCLHEGSVVDLRSADGLNGGRYMTVREGMEAFESTEQQYAAVYRALAK